MPASSATPAGLSGLSHAVRPTTPTRMPSASGLVAPAPATATTAAAPVATPMPIAAPPTHPMLTPTASPTANASAYAGKGSASMMRELSDASVASMDSHDSAASDELERQLFQAIHDGQRDRLKSLLYGQKDKAFQILMTVTYPNRDNQYRFDPEDQHDANELLGTCLNDLNAIHIAVLCFDEDMAMDILNFVLMMTEDTSMCVLRSTFLSRTCGNGNTVLHLAAFLGNAELVEGLLRAGAVTNKRNDKGYRASDCSFDPETSEILRLKSRRSFDDSAPASASEAADPTAAAASAASPAAPWPSTASRHAPTLATTESPRTESEPARPASQAAQGPTPSGSRGAAGSSGSLARSLADLRDDGAPAPSGRSLAGAIAMGRAPGVALTALPPVRKAPLKPPAAAASPSPGASSPAALVGKAPSPREDVMPVSLAALGGRLLGAERSHASLSSLASGGLGSSLGSVRLSGSGGLSPSSVLSSLEELEEPEPSEWRTALRRATTKSKSVSLDELSSGSRCAESAVAAAMALPSIRLQTPSATLASANGSQIAAVEAAATAATTAVAVTQASVDRRGSHKVAVAPSSHGANPTNDEDEDDDDDDDDDAADVRPSAITATTDPSRIVAFNRTNAIRAARQYGVAGMDGGKPVPKPMSPLGRAGSDELLRPSGSVAAPATTCTDPSASYDPPAAGAAATATPLTAPTPVPTRSRPVAEASSDLASVSGGGVPASAPPPKRRVRFEMGGLLLHLCRVGEQEGDATVATLRALAAETDIRSLVTPQQGMTPLHLACTHGHAEIAEFLVREAQVHVNARDREGWTPLHCAAAEGHINVIQILAKCQVHPTLGPLPNAEPDAVAAPDGPLNLVPRNDDHETPEDVCLDEKKNEILLLFGLLKRKFPPATRPVSEIEQAWILSTAALSPDDGETSEDTPPAVRHRRPVARPPRPAARGRGVDNDNNNDDESDSDADDADHDSDSDADADAEPAVAAAQPGPPAVGPTAALTRHPLLAAASSPPSVTATLATVASAPAAAATTAGATPPAAAVTRPAMAAAPSPPFLPPRTVGPTASLTAGPLGPTPAVPAAQVGSGLTPAASAPASAAAAAPAPSTTTPGSTAPAAPAATLPIATAAPPKPAVPRTARPATPTSPGTTPFGVVSERVRHLAASPSAAVPGPVVATADLVTASSLSSLSPLRPPSPFIIGDVSSSSSSSLSSGVGTASHSSSASDSDDGPPPRDETRARGGRHAGGRGDAATGAAAGAAAGAGTLGVGFNLSRRVTLSAKGLISGHHHRHNSPLAARSAHGSASDIGVAESPSTLRPAAISNHTTGRTPASDGQTPSAGPS